MSGDVFPPGAVPKELERNSFLDFLDRLRQAVDEDDSMEGYLYYEWGDRPGVYNVCSFVRVGNSMGQGGSILIRGDL